MGEPAEKHEIVETEAEFKLPPPGTKTACTETQDRCPMREMLARLGDKWTILVVFTLAQAPGNRLRFSQLQKGIQGISQRMLTLTLRNLERDGALVRHFFPEVPPRVEYELTVLGMSLLVPVGKFVEWIEANWQKIEQSRTDFDTKNPAKEAKDLNS